MAEATNELAFLATGAYGHPLARQHGAPLRLALPWKYGFKSIKSILRFSFTEQAPEGPVGSLATRRVWFLGERQPAGVASALKPGDRRDNRNWRAPADAAVQWLWRICRRALQRDGERASLGVISGSHVPIAPVRRLPPWPVWYASRRGEARMHRRRGRAGRY